MEGLFLSTLSLRRATIHYRPRRQLPSHFYPRSPCGERLLGDVWACRWPDISIHALLAESDFSVFASPFSIFYFYPRSPCGERHSFLSSSKNNTCYFYPRSPCGERHNTHTYRVYCPAFLSTLSLRRATLDELCRMMGIKHFYPRSPCGERLFFFGFMAKLLSIISIHALLAESDSFFMAQNLKA